jgi:hypothetical protein
LQRYDQPVFWTAWAEAQEHLTGDEHFARDSALLTVEVGETFGIAFVGPVEPESLHLGFDLAVSNQRGRRDAVADDVAGPGLDGVRRIAIVAHEPAGARSDVRSCSSDERVKMRASRHKMAQPTVVLRCLEAADTSADAPTPARESR